ncbi:hypothetical protein KV557_10790 [Kitasatospora aureofaciens]|uniref:hypothetical protein n=1 Tax=Kitasatospora aureofaciens TaxID=1894 RepID=UPI001C4779F4|nr:hypothetical protein [Kitasatospora aureofaciens]MBV6697612.1 hypothetical protein [Kitasatospora aureofaciens]
MQSPSPVTIARHAFDTGATPAEVYTTLARRTREPAGSARAVCRALGIPADETSCRLDDCFDALLANARPGGEADTGELLEALGVFDVPKSLDAHDLAVVDQFLAAIDAMGGIRAGHQHGLTRWFVTGNLTAAFLSLAATQPRPGTGDPTHYWTALITAGELLASRTPPDPRIKPALDRCRERARTTQP